jgi:hypothetical protein
LDVVGLTRPAELLKNAEPLPGGVAIVQSLLPHSYEHRTLGFSGAWLTSREPPPPCHARATPHRSIRRNCHMAHCRGPSNQMVNKYNASLRHQRSHPLHCAAHCVGSLLLARVLGLGRAHFPFGLGRRNRARHAVQMTRHQVRDGWAAVSASRLSRRRSFFFMPTT